VLHFAHLSGGLMAKDIAYSCKILNLEPIKKRYPNKFASEEQIFGNIHRGDRIFIHTGCGEPIYLVNALINYVRAHPKAFFDAELLQVWGLDLAPYSDEKFKANFRHNSLFLGRNTREAVNEGNADYTPIFLSEVPDIFQREIVPIDIALIQTSPPDEHGYMSLGVSLDIVKAAVEKAKIVITQINAHMPRIHGDGFVHIKDVNYAIIKDEPILEYSSEMDDDVAQKIGENVSRLVEDGDTIQCGYGSIPNAVLANLKDKKHLGVHTELLSDGLVELMKLGVIDNSKKTINRGRSIASFSMGRISTYDYLNDNPKIAFRTIDYTNSPLVIAKHDNMTAINSALEIDLTGQASAESLGKAFYSSVGGQTDFMRGAMLAKNGKTILAMASTAQNETISRISPCLSEGASVTLHRGDVHYVVTEYGVVYLHGKSVRERTMELITIAHPKFRSQLIKEAKARNLIYKDQAFIPGKKGEYPKELESYRTTFDGLEILLRPVKISDEPLLKDFFYDLSDKSMFRRFISERKDMPHERLQDFVIIDYTKESIILATIHKDEKEVVVGIGQYSIDERNHTADVAFAVLDEYHNEGIGAALLTHLTHQARRRGLLGFTAEVLIENVPMLHLFEKMGFDIDKRSSESVYELRMSFRSE